jgi:hypothetical protein
MNHFLNETLPLLLFGCGGILIMILAKINDLNHKPESDGLNFWDVLRKFFAKEWASYAASFVVVLVTASSHDEWLQWFAPDGKLSKLAEVPLGIKLGMVMFGMVGHWLLYKFVLGKMDKP